MTTFTGPLETTILAALSLWAVFYLINYADILNKPRDFFKKFSPNWLKYLLSCALCFSFWALTAISLFVGFTPLILWTPVVTLFVELGFRKLAGKDK
jgi:hypothetical protein